MKKNKLKEIAAVVKMYEGKDVLIWLAAIPGKEPYAEGTVKGMVNGYLVLKNTILKSGKFLSDWEISAPAISKIELKKINLNT